MVGQLSVWGIFFLPLASFILIALVVRPFLNRYSLLSGLLTIAALGLAFYLAVRTLIWIIQGHELELSTWTWLDARSCSSRTSMTRATPCGRSVQ